MQLQSNSFQLLPYITAKIHAVMGRHNNYTHFPLKIAKKSSAKMQINCMFDMMENYK